jgi:hypothetical protein
MNLLEKLSDLNRRKTVWERARLNGERFTNILDESRERESQKRTSQTLDIRLKTLVYFGDMF